MKKLSKGFSILTLAALVLVPVASYAQLHVDVSGEAGVNVNAAATSTNADGSIETDINADTDVNVGGQSNGSNRARGTSNANTALEVNAAGIAVTSAAQINSQSDLEIFTSNIVAQNKGLAKAEIHSDSEDEFQVEVVYQHKGKFLGFIPMTVRSTTMVEAKADGTVDAQSRLPWWSFLVTGENYAKADLESQIENNTTIKANSTTNASAQAKARVAEEVVMEVTANATAHAQVSN